MSLEAYVDRIFYDSSGHTGSIYYYRVVRRGDGKIWDAVQEEFSDTTTWANSIIEMEEKGITGEYPVVIPSNLPTGDTYSVVIYKQEGSNPANTDDPQEEYTLKHGSIFGF